MKGVRDLKCDLLCNFYRESDVVESVGMTVESVAGIESTGVDAESTMVESTTVESVVGTSVVGLEEQAAKVIVMTAIKNNFLICGF